MDPLKEAFQKIKEDILSLKNDISSLHINMHKIQASINTLEQTPNTHPKNPSSIPSPIVYSSNTSNTQTDRQTDTSLDIQEGETSPYINQNKPISSQDKTNQTGITSKKEVKTDNQTDIKTQGVKKTPLEPLYASKTTFSIGNGGVQTDKPTDKPTDRQEVFPLNAVQMEQQGQSPEYLLSTLSEFEKVNELLASLDDVKKEIRHKFKGLTPQEMLVFSTLYTLEDQQINEIGYNLLAKSINLTESSIRDYINKLIKKGVPIDKTRLNNKKIILNISQNLKKIATLSTILRLRDL